MSFNTPQTSGRDHQTPPPFSLLFSPSLKLPDGQKHSPSALGRSPSATPAPFGFAFGPSATPGQQQHQQQTPQSRRRSLTPASSMAKDTPPPPPVDSLLDTSPLLPPPTPTTPHVGKDSGHAPEDMSTSPGAAPPPPPTHTNTLDATYAAAGRTVRDYDSSWITVFGFSQFDVPLVLREFSKCGDIVQFGTFEDGPHVNWLHIRYTNKHAAQRALLRNGDQLSSACMVGVKPLDPRKKVEIERLEQQPHRRGGDGGGALEGRGGRWMEVPKPVSQQQEQRRSALRSSNNNNSNTVVPLPSKSAWDKVSEFILGI